MDDLVGLLVVFVVASLIVFVAVTLFWGFIAASVLAGLWVLWSYEETWRKERKAEHSKPSPEGP